MGFSETTKIVICQSPITV